MERKHGHKFVLVLFILFSVLPPILAEHGDGEGHHESIKNTAIVVILGVILLLTMFFEVLYEFIMEFVEHRHLEHMKKIIECVFRELTILGFISLLLFMTTRFGFVKQLNDQLFGKDLVEKTSVKELAEEGEPTEGATTVLFELFEEVHIFIFIIMVTFVFVVIGLLILGLRQSTLWRKYEGTSFDDLQRMVESGHASKDHVEYWIMRYKFMNPSTVFIPKPYYASFGFAEYLSERMCDLLVSLVQIPPSSWACLCIFALLLRPVMNFGPIQLIIFMFLTSTGLIVASVSLYLDCRRQLRAIRPRLSSVKNHIRQLAVQGYRGDISEADVDRVELIKRNSVTCEKIQRTSAVNRQEALFFFTAKGVPYQQKLMQLLIFLHTLTITCITKLTFSSHMQHVVFVPYGYWASFVPLALSIASIVVVWPYLLSTFTIVSSVGFFADKSALTRSTEKTQRRKLARNVQILNFLYHKADARFASKGAQEFNSEMQRAKVLYESQTQSVQKSYQDMFHAFAAPADVPRVTRKNLLLLITAFGFDERVEDCERKVEEWVEKLDVDKSNDLTFPEFTTLMMCLLKDTTTEDVDKQKQRDSSRLRDLFLSLDKDNDGFVTQEELVMQLTGIKPRISEDEARALMADIAGGRYGEMIRPDSFTNWVKETEERAKILMPQNGHDAGHH